MGGAQRADQVTQGYAEGVSEPVEGRDPSGVTAGFDIDDGSSVDA